MNTEIGQDGKATITRQSSQPGDRVDLLALVDVLTVPRRPPPAGDRFKYQRKELASG